MNGSNTPKKIDETVIKFCELISPGLKPEYVQVKPEIWCKLNECYDNVLEKVKTSGGVRQLGWRIQVIPDPFPKFMIEAVHHAIWIKKNGNKLDITPQCEEREIVFLPDDSIVLGDYRIGEKYYALINDPDVNEYVDLCNLESKEYTSKTKLDFQPQVPQELTNRQHELLAKIIMKMR